MASAAKIIEILDASGHLRLPFGTRQDVPLRGDAYYPTTLTDPRVVKGVASYQSMYATQLSPLIAKHYPERMAPVVRVDGVVGPATEELFDQPRCSCPDYTDATFQSRTGKALGAGGWKECHGTKGFHCVKIYEANEPPAHIKPHWEEIKRRFTAAEAKIGIRILFTKDQAAANVSLTWTPTSSGWIGLATVGNRAETCQTPLTQRWMQLLGGYTEGWSDVARKIHALVLLMLHEFGHVQSLQHASSSIMSAYLDESRPENWLDVGDAHESNMRSMFGNVPYPGDDTQPPPPPPSGKGFWPGLLVTDERTGKKGRIFDQAEV